MSRGLEIAEASLVRLATIARDAGAAILAAGGDQTSELKADQSPVTAADRAAHDVILSALAAWTPDIPVVSEEGSLPDHDVRRQWRQFWLVDPLDGTKEFLKNTGEYTVNIALIEGDEPVAGVVFAPAIDLLYSAARGLGAWRQRGREAPERLCSTPPGKDRPVVIAESRSHPSPDLEHYLQTIPVARRVQAGSSLKFCWVAEGLADIYPRFGPTMEWDTAAGDCVFRQSGCQGERRSPLRYNSPTLRHDGFVIGWE